MKKMSNTDIQNVCLEIMKDIHQFCQNNNIRYTLYGGSLIGAIRHNGFIPWDDDLDIAMPREDYERFIKSYQSAKGYSVLYRNTISDNSVYISYARVCEFNKTVVKQKTMWTKHQTGIWIDVFPLDSLENDIEQCKNRLNRIKQQAKKGIVLRHALSPLRNLSNMKRKIICIFSKIKVFFYKSNPYDVITEISKELDWDATEYFGNIVFTAYGIKERHHKSVLESYKLVTFEDTKFFIMSGYDEALSDKFGDYMTPPPMEKRYAKHNSYDYYWK